MIKNILKQVWFYEFGPKMYHKNMLMISIDFHFFVKSSP